MDEISKDPRFSHVPKDPKFRRIPKSEKKVKIDKRFQSMFNDKNFKVTYTIDKRGRPMKKSSSEDLEKFYELSSGDEEEENTEKSSITPRKSSIAPKKSHKSVKTSKKNSKIIKEETERENEESDDSEKSEIEEEMIENNENQLKITRKNESTKLDNEIKNKLKDLSVDYARGEGALLSDSSSDEDSADDASEDDEIEHMWGELDKEAPTTDEITSRLAACNMDWDRIRAVDLLVLFNSFLPPGGLIHSVTIYPSEFGLQRLKEEEMRGPIELTDSKEEDFHSGGDDEEEGNEFNREKLRQYQLNRLKYYYAVIAFDSKTSANKIYTECDGYDYESSATRIDLRFIPDDMEFDQEPKEICDRLPDISKYEPRQFTTTALQQVNPECTWDETKLDRQEITKKINSGKIDDIDENDIRNYLASGTSDDESDTERGENEIEGDSKKNRLDKYKSLLKSIEEQDQEKKRKDGDLEFTWGLGSKEKVEKLVQKKMKDSENLTPFEQFLEKRKEKKKAKREDKKKGKDVEEDEDSEDSIPSDVDMNDSYFAEEMKNCQSDKQKSVKKKSKGRDDESDEERVKREAELELLLLDGEDEGKHHFDMKKIEETEVLTKSKKKRLSKKKKEQKGSAVEDEFQVNVGDPRFNALFTSHHFNIDPADSHYRKTKGTEALIKEKLKRRADGEIQEEIPKDSKSRKTEKMNSDLAALIKSVKRNTKNVMKPL